MDRWARERGQELPPADGFPAVAHKRSLLPRGPPSWLLLSCAFLSIYAGMYMYGRSRRMRTELRRELVQRQIMLRPALLAEADLAALRAHGCRAERQRGQLGGAEKQPSPYHNARLFPTTNPTNYLAQP